MNKKIEKMSLNELLDMELLIQNSIEEKKQELRKSVSCKKVRTYYVLNFNGEEYRAYKNHRYNCYEVCNIKGNKKRVVKKEYPWNMNELRLAIAAGWLK